MHHGSPIRPDDNRFVVFLNGTLQVRGGAMSETGIYQCCSNTVCSVPVCAHLLEATPFHAKSPLSGIFWIHNSNPTGLYSFQEPATELECLLASSKNLIDLRVKWTYGLLDTADAEHEILLDFPTYNLSFPCSHDYSFFKDLVCYRFALALTRHPQKAITCHVHWQAVEESRSFRQLFLQPGNTYRLLPSDGETNEDELSFEEGADDSEVLLMREIASYMEPPNVTISSIECDFIVNVTCTAPFEPVELYITSHSSDLERCNGSWADLSSDQLSPVNFSVSNYVDVFLANASIRRIDGEDQFVVCRYLEKYDYRRLPISECSTHTGGRAFVFRICIIVVCYFAILLLATLTFWCWYSRRLRRRKRQAIAALIYRRDATLPTNVQHSYANAAGGGYLIFTEFSQSSRSGESSQQHVQSSVEDGQETREIDQSKLKSCANLHTQRMLPKPRPSLQLRRRGLVSVTCCYPPLPTLYRSIRGKGGLIFDHARKYFFVPLGRLRKSLVWFRRLRQVEVLLQYYIRIPKSARLLLLCQKRRAKVLDEPR